MKQSLFGFLSIYKPKGITSFDVIYKLRKILNIKKIGHSGTLDPLAEGVLVVAVGNASRLLEYLNGDKEYIAEIKFGEITDTYDDEGIKTFIETPDFSIDKLKSVIKEFIGVQEQIPPKYSAIKIGGRKSCDLARKNIEIPDIPKRKIEIYSIEILEFSLPIVKIKVACSKGVYIRSLVHDIGQKLLVGAYVKSLLRTRANGFSVDESISIENVTISSILNPINYLEYPKYILNNEEYTRIKNGNYINISNDNYTGKVMLLYNDSLIGIGSFVNSKIMVDKVLNIC